jgi:hypothetical protein
LPLANTGRILPANHTAPYLTCRIIYARIYSNVYLYAHSQGNVASGEALRLATNQIVNTYVASQGAVSARAYDNTIPPDATNYYAYLTTPDSEGYYYSSGSPSYFNGSVGTGRYVNFFNPQDWALMGSSLTHPGWLRDQSSKPDGYAGYNYIGPTLTLPFGYYYQHLGVNVLGHLQVANWPEVPLLFTTNTYQIFAMCCQSYSLALGAEPTVPAGFAQTVDLSDSPYNFGSTLIYHDGQFTIDNMTTAPYWRNLLTNFDINN